MATADGGTDPYQIDLPPTWRRFDRWLVSLTEIVACAVGMTFTVLISLEVVSRYVFSFSIFAINSAAVILLVWFFMLGAGLALRQGAHVGFELLFAYMSPPVARAAFAVGQTMTLLFFVAMAWSGVRSLGSASRQMEGALGISLVWVMLSIPVGFALLIYNQIAMLASLARKAARQGVKP